MKLLHSDSVSSSSILGKERFSFSETFLLISTGLFNSTLIQLREVGAPFFIAGSRGEELQVIFSVN